MEKADMVLVGAEGVVENGGIVNLVGTFPVAVMAQACGVPFYVAAESYKFARLFPLGQRDLAAVMVPRPLKICCRTGGKDGVEGAEGAAGAAGAEGADAGKSASPWTLTFCGEGDAGFP